MSARRFSLTLLTVLAGAACSGNAGLSDREAAAVDAWLNCGECTGGERAAVRAIGSRAVPVLRDRLLNGPPADRQNIMRLKLIDVHKAVVAKGGGITLLTQDQYVNWGLDNYKANQQKRAALMLAEIGGPAADSGLASAPMVPTLRADVRDAIRIATAQLSSNPFRGSVVSTQPGFGDTVIVRPLLTEQFTNDETAEVDGSPFQGANVLLFVEPGRLGFLATGPLGPRVLSIRNVGTTTNTQTTTIIIKTVDDYNDRRMLSCTDLACQVDSAPKITAIPNPLPVVFSLRRDMGTTDTLDIIKFQPPANLHVTAELTWQASAVADLDLEWATCAAPASLLAPHDGATGGSPATTVRTINAGTCMVLLVLLKATAPVALNARLKLTSP